ncbi:MAG: hypothetical protein ACT6FG_01600, partial [Methanosarcinaceae archaeon]
ICPSNQKEIFGISTEKYKTDDFQQLPPKSKEVGTRMPILWGIDEILFVCGGPPKDVTEVDRKITNWCGINAQP